MSLINAAVLIGGTVSTTGGTSMSLVPFLQEGPKITLHNTADTDFRLRRKMVCTASEPRKEVTAPNGYTQRRTKIRYNYPKLLANGKLTVNSVEITVSSDIEATDTEIQQLLDVGAQSLTDADFVAFHKTLAVG